MTSKRMQEKDKRRKHGKKNLKQQTYNLQKLLTFRACMVAMTAVLKKMLDDENIKPKLLEYNSLWEKEAKNEDKDGIYRSSAVRNFHPEYIPFRMEENKSTEIFFPLHFSNYYSVGQVDSA